MKKNDKEMTDKVRSRQLGFVDSIDFNSFGENLLFCTKIVKATILKIIFLWKKHKILPQFDGPTR